MSFSFNATANASQSSNLPRLEGNLIHTVKIKECVIEDIQGKEDPSKVFKVIKIKFVNDDGIFEQTVFEPNESRGDFSRTEKDFTNKNGNTEKIPQPSGVESMMLLFKHIIDGFVPEIGKEIDNGTKSLGAKDWNDLRLLVKKILDKSVNTNKIKLLKHKKTGESVFPGFFAGVSREGKAYVRNNFIGDKIGFTPYELTRIKNESEAIPTKPNSSFGGTEDIQFNKPDTSNLDLDFDNIDL